MSKKGNLLTRKEMLDASISKPIGNELMEYGNMEDLQKKIEKFLKEIGEHDVGEFIQVLKLYKFLIVQGAVSDMSEKSMIFRNGAMSVLDVLMKLSLESINESIETRSMLNSQKYKENYVSNDESTEKLKELFGKKTT